MGVRGGCWRARLRPGGVHSRAAAVLDRALARARRATVSRLGMVARLRDTGEDVVDRAGAGAFGLEFTMALGGHP